MDSGVMIAVAISALMETDTHQHCHFDQREK
jgi:hypothetical protein